MENVFIAFLLTLMAGLSTAIGSILAFFTRRTNTKLLSVALGFSAGVMIYVSFVELLIEGEAALKIEFGDKQGTWIAMAAFFGGILLSGIIDKLVPSFENPHEIHKIEEMANGKKVSDEHKAKLFRVGFMTAVAITIHNFPEGLATFTAALKDPAMGASIAVAIAIHNIPEGIAVAIPIYYATGDRKKASIYSSLSGFAEPLGALVGFLILMPFFNEIIFGILFALIAGIMVFISFDELLPAAREYGEHHLSIYGLVVGMAVMAVSLALL